MKVKFCCAFGGIGKASYYELLKSNQTITAEYYQQQLIDLNRALNHKCPIAQRKCKMILLHNNARPHVAKIIKDMLSTLQWKVLPHTSYSSDIPSDYHLFQSMQHGFANQL